MIYVRLAALLATATLLATGCSDDDPEPRIEPTRSASPSGSPTTPSPTEPTETAEPLDPESTVKAWIEAQNDGLKTGDTSELERLSAPSCQTCQEFIDPVKDVYAAGGRFETKGWRVSSVRLRDPSATPLEVDAAVIIQAGSTFPDATSAPVVYEEDKTIIRFSLVGNESLAVSFIGFLS